MKMLKTTFLFSCALLLIASTAWAAFVADDTNCKDANIDAICKTVEQTQCDSYMKQCLAFFEAKAKIFDQGAKQAQGQAKTLKNEIGSLQSKISKLDNEISKNNILVKDLSLQVNKTSASISEASFKIEDLRQRLSVLLREIQQSDNQSALEVFLSQNDINDMADELMALESFSSQNKDFLESAVDLKDYLQNQKVKLSDQKDKLEDVIEVKEDLKEQNQALKQQKDVVLKTTKQQEAEFLKYKTQAEVEAAKIRSRIFELAGVSDSTKAPSFGEALAIAQKVATQIGVRPAFVLAIFAQETRIGKNVGKCYIAGANGLSAVGKKVMRPNQAAPFIEICKAAGLDFTKTPVSCPAPQIGCTYGGAMGPAQFMPTTWNLFKDQISAYVGHAPNPWNFTDAMYAASLFLKDAGANANAYGERTAAKRYFGGDYGYPSGVAAKATCIQTFIDTGTMSASCQAKLF